MKSGIARVLLLSFLVLVLAGAWYKPLEGIATPQIDAGLNRALISFATARTLNAIISTIQSTELSFQPLGVGTSFAPGQILRPINELIAQFAELMLAASIAFGVMKVLISIGSFWVISLLMSAFALSWGWFRWRGQQAPIWIERLLFVLLFVRFAMPLVTVGSDAVFQRFMQDDYTKSQKAIEGNRGELMTLAPTIDESNTGKGFVEQIKTWWSNVNLVEWLKKLKQVANQVADHIVKLIVVFLMQTLVIPLLLFWALYRGGKAIIVSPSRAT
jgi:hypothetical protein